MRYQLIVPAPGGSPPDPADASGAGESPQISVPEGREPGELDEMLADALARIDSPDAAEAPATAAGRAVQSPTPTQTPQDPTKEPRSPAQEPPAPAQATAFPVQSWQLWIRHVTDGDDEVARGHGFEPCRDLWQLRCRLPRPQQSDLETRAFAEADVDEFVAVNNRAFHWHPEQGGLTADAVRAQMSETWFDADGFRLHHRQGRLAGFCWTKIHDDASPPLGEIYVIAVDPDFAGRGLGRPMTLAGLDWLAERGLAVGMLYVESDNHPANAVYRRIGFARHHTDRAYRRAPR